MSVFSARTSIVSATWIELSFWTWMSLWYLRIRSSARAEAGTSARSRTAAAPQKFRISGRGAGEGHFGRALDRRVIVLVKRLFGKAHRPRDQRRRGALGPGLSGTKRALF